MNLSVKLVKASVFRFYIAGNCSLLHGKAVPLDSTTGYGGTNMYTFTCDDGYVLDGVRRGLCLEFTKPHCRCK